MIIIETAHLNVTQREAIFKLWNREYPHQLMFDDFSGLHIYLNDLKKQIHYFAVDGNDDIRGWAFVFERESEKWFAMIIDSALQRNGIGTSLLFKLKETEPILNGWVIDHDKYVKQNGEAYTSPLAFYQKNNFEVYTDVRLETEKLSAVKIKWILKS